MSEETLATTSPPGPDALVAVADVASTRTPVDWLTFGFLVMFLALAVVVTSLILIAYNSGPAIPS